VYQAQTRPLVDFYSNLAAQAGASAPQYRKIAGVGAVDDIRERALGALK
jgi:adenylate kinase